MPSISISLSLIWKSVSDGKAAFLHIKNQRAREHKPIFLEKVGSEKEIEQKLQPSHLQL